MIGVLIAIVANLASEISTSIGKFEIRNHKESYYTMGFLSTFWAAMWFLCIALYRDSFVFSLASLPTFVARVVLEIILAHVAIRAVAKAERSTFSFLRVVTVPLVLLVDLALGYDVSPSRMLGIGIILAALVITTLAGGIHKGGRHLVLLSSVIAVATITLYKYNITHYNSVEAELLVTVSILAIYFYINLLIKGEHPFRLLVTYPYAVQSVMAGLASVLAGFAFLFAPASVIIGAERSSAILWSVLSGRLYFKERHLLLKLTTFVLLSAGLILLIG